MTTPAVQEYVRGLKDAAKPLPRKIILTWLLLFKRICDQWEEAREANAARPENGGRVASFTPADRLMVPANYSWADIRRLPRDIGRGLNAAFHAIEEANPSLTSLLSCLDFSDRESFPDSTFHSLFASFDRLRLGASEVDEDTFGWMCEELMQEAADDARRSEPGSRTPRQVARLLVEILQPQEGMSIYDGACGSGGMLLECYSHLKRLKRNYDSLRLYGQEIESESWALCRINLFCHGIQAAVIERGDTLRSPRHLTGDGRALMTFDRVISHPPFKLKEWGFDEWSQGDRYGRSDYGIPAKSCGDLAFLEHSVSSLNDKGMLGMVAPQGVLFHAREEGEIRRRMLQDDLVEAVITIARDALPPAPEQACLLILNKAKPKERRGKILMVNDDPQASAGSSGNGLSDEAIDRISSAFHAYKDKERLCRVVSLGEIERNGYTLNVARCVPTGGEEPRTDLASEWQILLKLIDERNEAERKLTAQIGRLERPSDDA